MSTTYNHIRMSTIDSSNNISVLYPESTSSDILVSRVNNTNIPNNVSNIQLLANALANSAFNNIINDNTTSSNYTWSSYKINNKVSTINFYVDSNGSKLHFTNSDNEDNVIDYTSGSGTATSDKVLQGYTFSNSNGVDIPGTMLNQGTKEYTINPGNTQTIPEGYHSGNGSVSVNGKNKGLTMSSTQISGNIDMGINNTYRYVNATNVYNKGIIDGATVHTGTYTLTNTGTTDLGVDHTYRYVSSGNLYKVDSVLVSASDTVYGSLKEMNGSNINYSNENYRFKVINTLDGVIKLLGLIQIRGTNGNAANSYSYNVDFEAGAVLDRPISIANAHIPSYFDLKKCNFNNINGNENCWTSTRESTYSSGYYYYYLNANGSISYTYYDYYLSVVPFINIIYNT